MHPELLNNSHFLRYYKRWQENPESIVFAPIAEYLLSYSMIDEAFRVCRQGIKRHPMLVSGRIVMAKIHMKRGNWEEAGEELNSVLSEVPGNAVARALMAEISGRLGKEDFPPAARVERAQASETADAASSQGTSAWNTVTMANIYASQGHLTEARTIYRSILDKDPENAAARDGLESLPAG